MTIVRKLDKAQLYLAWRLARFCRAIIDDGFHVFKAELLLMGLQIFFIVGIFPSILELFFGVNTSLDRGMFLGIAFVVAFFFACWNHFLVARRLHLYDSVFSNYPKLKSRLLGLAILAFVLGLIAVYVGLMIVRYDNRVVGG